MLDRSGRSARQEHCDPTFGATAGDSPRPRVYDQDSETQGRHTAMMMMMTTVKPLMFACPLFHEFHEPNKTAKLRA